MEGCWGCPRPPPGDAPPPPPRPPPPPGPSRGRPPRPPRPRRRFPCASTGYPSRGAGPAPLPRCGIRPSSPPCGPPAPSCGRTRGSSGVRGAGRDRAELPPLGPPRPELRAHAGLFGARGRELNEEWTTRIADASAEELADQWDRFSCVPELEELGRAKWSLSNGGVNGKMIAVEETSGT